MAGPDLALIRQPSPRILSRRPPNAAPQDITEEAQGALESGDEAFAAWLEAKRAAAAADAACRVCTIA